MANVTHVFGLSGVGKSWLCERFAARHGAVHASASALLREAKRSIGEPTDSEGLRQGSVMDNQQLLVREFDLLRAKTDSPILLDAHNVVDDDTSLVQIPLSVVQGLAPDLIVFIRSDPAAIIERRASDATRQRPMRDEATLERHQELAMALAHSHAKDLGVPFVVVEAGDEITFAAALAR